MKILTLEWFSKGFSLVLGMKFEIFKGIVA